MKRGRPPYDDILTPREWEVACLLREGLTNEQIAARLDITLSGAKYHVTQILSKLQVSTRDAAVRRLEGTPRWSQRRHAGLLSFLLRLMRPSTLMPAAIVVVVSILGLGLLHLRSGGSADEPDPGPVILTPDRQLVLPDMTVMTDDRYRPDEFPSLIAVLRRSYDSTCEPACEPSQRAGVILVRPSDGSIAAEIRLATGGILAVTRPSHNQLLIGLGQDDDAALLLLDATDEFSLERVLAIPNKGTHRVFLGTDFVLSNDEQYLYYRSEQDGPDHGCAAYHQSYVCVVVLDLQTGELRRAAEEAGCAHLLHPSGDSDVLVTCPQHILHLGPNGAVHGKDEVVYWEQPNTGTPRALSNYYAFRMDDGQIGVLSSQGVLTYREPDGTVVHEPLLPAWLQLYGLGPPFQITDGRVLFGVTSVPVTGHYAAGLGKASIFDPTTLTMSLPFDFGEASYISLVPRTDDIAVLRYDGAIDILSPEGTSRRVVRAGILGDSSLVLVK